MAVVRENFTEQEGVIKITNGDFKALQTIAKEYNLNDESDVIAFAIGILSQAKGKAITIEREDGSVLKLIPSEKLRSKAA